MKVQSGEPLVMADIPSGVCKPNVTGESLRYWLHEQERMKVLSDITLVRSLGGRTTSRVVNMEPFLTEQL